MQARESHKLTFVSWKWFITVHKKSPSSHRAHYKIYTHTNVFSRIHIRRIVSIIYHLHLQLIHIPHIWFIMHIIHHFFVCVVMCTTCICFVWFICDWAGRKDFATSHGLLRYLKHLSLSNGVISMLLLGQVRRRNFQFFFLPINKQ